MSESENKCLAFCALYCEFPEDFVALWNAPRLPCVGPWFTVLAVSVGRWRALVCSQEGLWNRLWVSLEFFSLYFRWILFFSWFLFIDRFIYFSIYLFWFCCWRFRETCGLLQFFFSLFCFIQLFSIRSGFFMSDFSISLAHNSHIWIIKLANTLR